MRKLLKIGTLALASTAGAAQGDIGFGISSGFSIGFCGSGFSISSGLYLGSSWGCNSYYRPRIGWYDRGYCGSYYPSYRRNYRSYGPRYYSYPRPRYYRSGWDNCWSDAELSLPYRNDVVATHDRAPNRAPEIKDEVSSEDRTADAWELLEQGKANQAQGFFALAAAKDPENAQIKLGFALASAELGDNTRAAWSAGRAVGVDQGELAELELGDKASLLLADLLDELSTDDRALASDLEAAMPDLVTLPVIADNG